MAVSDVDAALLIERQAFKQPWSRHMYLTDLQHNRLASYLVVRPAPGEEAELPAVLAYGGIWLMVDEAHVATIASHPDWRGCGLGEYLLVALLEEAQARGAVTSTLEVRVGNLVAIALYQKLGYAVAGTRRRYYQDGEDAYLMTTPPLRTADMQARLAQAGQDCLQHLAKCFDRAPMDAPTTATR